MEAETEDSDGRAARLNITVKPETKARLDAARYRTGSPINVSNVCDAAINAELDRLAKPGLADVIARLRVESDRRRGAPYRLGHLEGQSWARLKGSWAEICGYVQLDEGDVQIAESRWTTKDGKREWKIPGFAGRFRAPFQDYPKWTPQQHGAPGFAYEEEEGRPEDDMNLCDQYWRGWLAGVKDIYAGVSEELDPIDGPADLFGQGNIDPDDIPF